jgi:hypothetical protein
MSTLSYFVNQLDIFDQRLHEPLYNVTYGRDIKLRTDVNIFNESSSFTRASFGAIGSQSAVGKPWLAQNSNTLPNISIDGERIVTPVRTLGQEIVYSSIELEKSIKLTQPLDVQKYNAMNIMHQMWTDEQVYIGDKALGVSGLVNSSVVTTGPSTSGPWLLPNGAPAASSDAIIAAVNELLDATYKASAYAICPNKILLPHPQFALLCSQKVSVESGNYSLIEYLKRSTICLAVNGVELDIQPTKWLSGAGVGGSDRMIAYTNDEQRVRFPMVPIRRETPYYLGINFHAPYVWALGEVEFVYPETLQYRDGI